MYAMSVDLEGGCRVTTMREGEPEDAGALRTWRHFDSRISLRVVELLECSAADSAAGPDPPPSGRRYTEHTVTRVSHDEVLYDLARDEGIYIPAGATVTLHGPGTYVSSLTPAERSGRKAQVVRLADQPRQKTADRWYAELIQAEVTQFVGSIPPGRAPDHFHLYEEVICILDGQGIMHAGASSTPVSAGSCIFLPIRQRHSLENTGSGELRLLGVFYPAGSPAVRYPA
jgi:mannose-6-phosphate isomerase-like protein (cupin superfamily)